MSGRLRATSDFTELVFLVLGHLPIAGPANLFDPRLVSRAAELLPAADVEVLKQDAPRLAAFASPAWQAWPELFADLDGFAAARHRDLADLRGDDVASPGLLEQLRREGVGAELMHATLALLAPGFALVHREVLADEVAKQIEPVGAAIGVLAVHVPSLGDANVEVSGSLGGHGRGFAHRVVVGSPAPWHSLSALDTGLWALHEHLVRQGQGDFVDVEWAALTTAAAALAGAVGEVRAAQRRWLRRLELTGLLRELERRGLVDAARAAELRGDPASLMPSA